MKLWPFDHCKNPSIAAVVKRKGSELEFSYLLEGDSSDLVIPPASAPMRTDGLWKSTCFEAFIGIGEAGYVELNFATSGQWAAYSFTNYREGMRELDIAPPKICFADNCLVATIEFVAQPGSPLNVAAVIERKDGTRGYWALAHPEGNRPDFHVRDCFVAKLP
ncbi:MAG TPA: DOMON-like domain-containing protein [Sphingomicrobium sp.]|nr:DOMON-like domain-containing protein [Sphingomicrobium sp.]